MSSQPPLVMTEKTAEGEELGVGSGALLVLTTPENRHLVPTPASPDDDPSTVNTWAISFLVKIIGELIGALVVVTVTLWLCRMYRRGVAPWLRRQVHQIQRWWRRPGILDGLIDTQQGRPPPAYDYRTFDRVPVRDSQGSTETHTFTSNTSTESFLNCPPDTPHPSQSSFPFFRNSPPPPYSSSPPPPSYSAFDPSSLRSRLISYAYSSLPSVRNPSDMPLCSSSSDPNIPSSRDTQTSSSRGTCAKPPKSKWYLASDTTTDSSTDNATDSSTDTSKNALIHVIFITGRRYDLNDKQIKEFSDMMKYQDDLMFLALPEFFPWLNYLPACITKRLCQVEHLKASTKIGKAMMEEVIAKHRENFDPASPRDLLDEFLLEMKAVEDSSKDVGDTPFNEIDLVRTIFDLFTAGYDTTSNMLRWIILYMAAYPRVQLKVQEELDEVVPRDTLPSHQYRHRLSYLEAVIYEVLRVSSIVTGGVPHVTAQDTLFAGYFLPKLNIYVIGIGQYCFVVFIEFSICQAECVNIKCILCLTVTFLLSQFEVIGFICDTYCTVDPSLISKGYNLACHMNPESWEDPEVFRPERFLDEVGKFIAPKVDFLPFGVGK
ncbi:hypothetical protein Pmani_023223 [Petrolisthes manimaculis]|uniref:Cytochrome P450 n=1 Tax=Petrolisthes manimaculis TaxID=1843537 RepID=A0AAE1PCV3_9EUCA|nr:hypothetical protein Pmani_023223 [Petrolisthes manimaculis]